MNNKFQALQQNVIQWATDRGIFDKEHGSSFNKQYLKFLSELGELSDAVLKNDTTAIKDAIGDCIVCLINADVLSENGYSITFTENDIQELKEQGEKETLEVFIMTIVQHSIESNLLTIYTLLLLEQRLGFEFCECLEYAYNEIKDRKGKMINGAFVKEV